MKLIALAAAAAVSLSACAGVPTATPAPTVTITATPKPTYAAPTYAPPTYAPPSLLEEVWSEKYNSEEKADFCFTWSISTTSQKQEAFYNAEMNTLVSWTEFFAFFNGECGA